MGRVSTPPPSPRTQQRASYAVLDGFLRLPGGEMLSWNQQLEMVHAFWRYPEVTRELKDVLSPPSRFNNLALGWICQCVGTAFDECGGTPTEATVLAKFEALAPHMVASCCSGWKSVTAAPLPSAQWAIEAGRKFALVQEAKTLAGQLEGYAEAGQLEKIRNRAEELAALGRRVQVEDEFVVMRLSETRTERADWLWKGFIPCGKVALLDGFPGLGKSTILLDVAARLSRGAPMPLDGMLETQPADTVILSAEDAVADTIRPRLEAAGADLTRIHAITAVRVKDDERGFVVLQDLERLENLVGRLEARFVIVDPLVAFLGLMDFHRDQDMRKVLRALAGLAERRRCSIVCVRHLNKSQGAAVVTRGGGSIGVIGAARVGLLMAMHPTEPEERVLAVAKTNLSRPPMPLRLRLQDVPEYQSPRVDWIGRSEHTVEELVK